VRPGGAVIVSDVVWRRKPEAPLGEEWGHFAAAQPIGGEEYGALMKEAGLSVEQVHLHALSAWEEYWRPMLALAQEAKTAQPADIFFADEVERAVALERRAVEMYIDYATFVARKR
jgi:hypothetical protein